MILCDQDGIYPDPLPGGFTGECTYGSRLTRLKLRFYRTGIMWHRQATLRGLCVLWRERSRRHPSVRPTPMCRVRQIGLAGNYRPLQLR